MNLMYKRTCLATLIASIATAAIVPLSAHADGMSIIGIGEVTSSIRNADPQSFQTMLETQLIKTGKFNVIERSRLAEILREKGLGAAGITTSGGTISGVQGVDYLVYGTITKLGQDQQAQNIGGFGHMPSGFASASSKVEMAVDLRVVDAHTGSIKYADSVEEQVSAGSAVAVGGLKFGNKASDPLGDVQRLTAKSITSLITTTIYPVRVITQESDGLYVLNYGDSVLTVGDVLKVYKVGESFKDPDTGKILGADETQMGLLKVSETTAGFSKATLVSGSAQAGNTARRLSSADANKIAVAKRGPALP